VELVDLPSNGKRVVLPLQARRFFGPAAACERKIFVERHQRVRHLHADGQSIRCIAAMVGLHRDTVRRAALR
jgi:hypothetical protein